MDVSVIDASSTGERGCVEVEASATLFELRHLLLSLTLPSCTKALAGAHVRLQLFVRAFARITYFPAATS